MAAVGMGVATPRGASASVMSALGRKIAVKPSAPTIAWVRVNAIRRMLDACVILLSLESTVRMRLVPETAVVMGNV
jgi:NAD kinase